MTKREWIEELIRLTQQQEKALHEEDIDTFTTLLYQRQKVLDEIEELHQAQPMLREQHEEDLVEELRRLDNKNLREFERQFEEVKINLREIRQKKRREECYSNTYDISWEEGVFFDKKEKR